MNKYTLQLIFIFVLVFCLMVDYGLADVIYNKGFLLLSIIFLQILINIKSGNTYVLLTAFSGIIFDWYNKTFLGVSSLILIVSLYLFNALQIRFHANRALMAVMNFTFAIILSYAYYGYENSNLAFIIVSSIVSTAITSYFWIKK